MFEYEFYTIENESKTSSVNVAVGKNNVRIISSNQSIELSRELFDNLISTFCEKNQQKKEEVKTEETKN